MTRVITFRVVRHTRYVHLHVYSALKMQNNTFFVRYEF